MSQIVPVQPIQQINTNLNVPGGGPSPLGLGMGFLNSIGIGAAIGGWMQDNLPESNFVSGRGSGAAALSGKIQREKDQRAKSETLAPVREALGVEDPYPKAPKEPAAPVAPTGREVIKPTGTGTQLSGRSASYDEVMDFLGSYASQYAPGMQSTALPNTPAGYGQLDHGTGFTAEAVIKQNPGYAITPGATPTKIAWDGTVKPEISLTDTGYQTVDSLKGAQSTVIPDDPQNSGINWANRTAADNSDESMRRRRAFLDAGSAMEGLKARDAMYGKVYAGGQYHEIPEKGGKVEVTYEPGKVQEMMRADVGSDAQAEAQSFLANYKDSIKTGAAASQNPTLNADEDGGKGGTVALEPAETDFVENNASPTEMVPMLKDGFINGKLPAGSMPTSRLDFGGAFSDGFA